jgi:hypothetical protein
VSNFIVDSFVYTFTSDEPSAKRGRTGITIALLAMMVPSLLAIAEKHYLGILGALLLLFIGSLLYAIVYAATEQIDTIAKLNKHH